MTTDQSQTESVPATLPSSPAQWHRSAVDGGSGYRDRSAAPANRTTGEIPEVSTLIRAAGHHLLLTLCLALVAGAGLAILAWGFVPAEYTATSFVRVRHRGDFLVSSQSSRADDAIFVRNQKAAVTLPAVLQQAIESDEIAAVASHLPSRDAAQYLADKTDVEFTEGGEVLKISVRHENPQAALAMSTALTSAYLEQVESRMSEERERRRTALEHQLAIADARMNAKWTELKSVANDLGTGNPETLSLREQIQLESYREYAGRLRAVQVQKNQLESQLTDAHIMKGLPVEISEAELDNAMAMHPEVATQQQRLIALEVQRRELAEIVPNNESRRMLRLEEDIEYYTQQLSDLIENLRPRLRTQMMDQQRVLRESEVTRLEQQINVANQEETFLRERLAQLEKHIDKVGGRNGIQLEVLRHEIDRQEAIADSLWRSLEQLRIEDQADSRVSLLTPAKMPTQPYRGKQLKTAMLAGGSAVLCVIFAIGFLEWKSCRIRGPEELQRRTGITLFGTGSFATGLPLLWRWRHGRKDPLNSGVNEAVARLIFQYGNSSTTKLPSILVTSASSTEPRHVVAIELAMSLARTGRKVLLIDCNRTPSRWVKRWVRRNDCGLMQMIQHRRSSAGFVAATDEPGLDVMSSGSNGGPVEFAERDMKSAFAVLRQEYDCVVVNGPSLLTTTNVVFLGSSVELALFSVVLGKSRWNLVNAASERLEQVGMQVLGGVLHNPTHQWSTSSVSSSSRSRSRDVADDQDDVDAAYDRDMDSESTEQELQDRLRELREAVRDATSVSESQDDSPKPDTKTT